MWLTPFEKALMALGQKIPDKTSRDQKREAAYKDLKEISGEDFGYDIESWYKWYLANHERSNIENGCNFLFPLKRYVARRWWAKKKRQKPNSNPLHP